MKNIQKLALFMSVLLSVSLDASQWKALLPSKNMARVAAVAAGCALTVQNPTQAELLIVKKDKQGLAPLSDLDAKKYGPVISQTLLKYQWPMCTSQDLTDQEKDELLTADKPCAEELFIEKKLQEKLGSDDFDPAVIFIPTTLYELFCLDLLSKKDEVLLNEKNRREALRYGANIDLYPLLNRPVGDVSQWLLLDYENLDLDLDRTTQDIYKSVYDRFDTENKHFFNDDQNISLYVNQLFIQWLFKKYPELKSCKNAADASKFIQSKSGDLASNSIHEIIKDRDSKCYDHWYSLFNMCHAEYSALSNSYIKYEYEARNQNKAILSRGCPDIINSKHQFQDLMLIADIYVLYNMLETPFKSYSVSFGNSLYAGGIFGNDSSSGASLMSKHFSFRNRENREISKNRYELANGLLLFIDKKIYMQDRCSHLFFIPSLSVLASFMSAGEFFHPRTTAALEKGERIIDQQIKGLCGGFRGEFYDTAGIIKIERDPLLQAELFSDFVAKNGRVLQSVDDKKLTKQDKQVAEQILKNQAVAAQAYRKMREDAARLNAAK